MVPGGALSSEDGTWYASSPSFFLPVKALSRLFRGKFRARIRKAALLDQIPSETWQQDWNVNCQAVPNAEASIQYLAPYVFKVAISDHRILKVEETSVSFSYKKPGSARLRTLTLDPLEFIRRFLKPCVAQRLHESPLLRLPLTHRQGALGGHQGPGRTGPWLHRDRARDRATPLATTERAEPAPGWTWGARLL
jgi:hypothetical protein